jgi:hypothetical protein
MKPAFELREDKGLSGLDFTSRGVCGETGSGADIHSLVEDIEFCIHSLSRFSMVLPSILGALAFYRR